MSLTGKKSPKRFSPLPLEAPQTLLLIEEKSEMKNSYKRRKSKCWRSEMLLLDTGIFLSRSEGLLEKDCNPNETCGLVFPGG